MPSARKSSTVPLSLCQFKLGLRHGHRVIPWGDLDSLAMLQRQLDVDILVTGHTHRFTAYKHEGGVVINPGSATGAFGSITYDVNPSFVLMDIDGLRVVVCVYELIDETANIIKELHARKISFGTKSMIDCLLLKRRSTPKFRRKKLFLFQCRVQMTLTLTNLAVSGIAQTLQVDQWTVCALIFMTRSFIPTTAFKTI